MNHKSYECHLQTAQRYEKERWLIDVSDSGESKKDGQKAASSKTQVKKHSSRVKQIKARHNMEKEEDERDERDKDEEEDEEVVEGKGWVGGGGRGGVAATARLKP